MIRPSRLHGALLLLPALLVLLVLLGSGVGFALAQSVGLINLTEPPAFTLRYFREALGSTTFAQSFGLTLYIALASTVVASVLSLGLALLLRRAFRASGAIRLLVQLPLPVPHLVAAIGMVLLLSQSGLIARGGHALGLVPEPANFPPLTNDRWAVAIILTYVWKEVPFIALAVLAVLQGIGHELEAQARNLGASRWQALWHVVLPLVLPALLGAATIVFAFTFGAFEVPLLLGQSFPRTLSVEVYQQYASVDLAARPLAMALTMVIVAVGIWAVIVYAWLIRRYTQWMT